MDDERRHHGVDQSGEVEDGHVADVCEEEEEEGEKMSCAGGQ